MKLTKAQKKMLRIQHYLLQRSEFFVRKDNNLATYYYEGFKAVWMHHQRKGSSFYGQEEI